MKNTLKIKGYKVKTHIGNYRSNNNLAISLITDIGEPFATLTVNINTLEDDYLASVDTNNCPWAEDFIKDNKLGTPTGMYQKSGWCSYPVYRFDLDEVKKYS